MNNFLESIVFGTVIALIISTFILSMAVSSIKDRLIEQEVREVEVHHIYLVEKGPVEQEETLMELMESNSN